MTMQETEHTALVDGAEEKWGIYVTNYEYYESHMLSEEDVTELLNIEAELPFNGIFVSLDIDPKGRLGIYYMDSSAIVMYENYSTGRWLSSSCEEYQLREDWNRVVRLSPRDSEEYSFLQCAVIEKDLGIEIVKKYISTFELERLYPVGTDCRPITMAFQESFSAPRTTD
jgi:hypothetical protein